MNPDFKSHTLTCVTGGGHQVLISTYWNVNWCELNESLQRIKSFNLNLLECEYERLQTLPDNYTEGVSNTARYTAIGNGWTVDVIAHILKGLRDE